MTAASQASASKKDYDFFNKFLFEKLENASCEQERHQIIGKIVEANNRLVWKVAKYYAATSGAIIEELIQEGIQGLLKAIEKFDPHRDIKFSTFAVNWIRQAISRNLSKHIPARVYRLPAHVDEDLYRLNRAEQRLCSRVEELTPESIAREMVEITLENYRKKPGKMPFEQFEQATYRRYNTVRVSRLCDIRDNVTGMALDAPTNEDRGESSALIHTVKDPAPSFEEKLLRDEKIEQVRRLLARLTPRQRLIIIRRMEKTLDEVGKELHISRERVRQVQSRSLQKLLARIRNEIYREDGSFWKDYIGHNVM